MGISIFYGGFTHTQSTPAAVWTIDHTMGRHPIVDVVVEHQGKQEVILPLSVHHESNSQVIITFSEPFAGTARLG